MSDQTPPPLPPPSPAPKNPNSQPPYETPETERPASAAPTEQDLEQKSPFQKSHDPYAALRYPDARSYLIGNFLSVLGTQMLSVAIGWEIYQLTNSETALGLVGLAQAIPIILMALPAGHVADASNRKRIILLTQTLLAFFSLALAAASFFQNSIPQVPLLQSANHALASIDSTLGSWYHKQSPSHFTSPAIPVMYLILFLNGIVRSFNDPARNALLPSLVPLPLISNAITWASSNFQTAAVIGPAIGGLLLVATPPSFIYSLDALGHLALFFFLLPIANPPPKLSKEKPSLKTLAAGMHFVWTNQIILATITLDLFAVLLGGAVALLPVYATLLHTGAIGYGFMRAAPSIGAVLMSLYLSHRRPMQHAGRDLLIAVIGFGLATIIFGLTPLLPTHLLPTLGLAIALLMLFFTGVTDNVSVVVRHSLVQILTPDSMRGRVSAVNNVFIGSSNELGAFESGITAAMFGPLASVVAGGIGTILVVAATALIWPQVRKVKSLHDIKPVELDMKAQVTGGTY